MVMSHSLEKIFCLGPVSTNVHYQVQYWCGLGFTIDSRYRPSHPSAYHKTFFKVMRGFVEDVTSLNAPCTFQS